MENQASKRKSTAKIIADVIIWIIVVFVVLITISVFSSQANGGVPNFFGNIPVTIQSDSMVPTFKKGDMIFDKKVTDKNALKKDDIITFWTIIDGKRVMNTHKIVEVQANSFITKGEANALNDAGSVTHADVVGIYTGTKIGGMGRVMDFFQSSLGFLFFVVLPLLLFFLYQVYKFISVIIMVKKPAISSEAEDEIKKKAIEDYIKQQAQENEKQDS